LLSADSAPNTGHNVNKGTEQRSGKIRSQQVLTVPANTGYNTNESGKQTSGDIEIGTGGSGCQHHVIHYINKKIKDGNHGIERK